MEQFKTTCTTCTQETRLRALETAQAENKVYLEQILKRQDEMMLDLKDRKEKEKVNPWQGIVAELIRLATTAMVMLGTLAGADKLLTK